ncbi:PIR Superfamily Protein [Plasmodium ovale wallikeri]|uniref:PIR Superfamily Protein n=1 Tax=Plasmodium ovale wallikeri TaxID=864142 RepID=A0A1A9AQS7_PLAOA|nr:PIR Superfamily Protein [Plasmodium ovale wallikeri]SBT59522.1 PIR Superfamily Protein [Plasmodium ovale wallikeri]
MNEKNKNCKFTEFKQFLVNFDICNIWGKVKKILELWDSVYENFNDIPSNKKCEYLNYWVYDKLKHIKDPSDIILFYIGWQQYVSSTPGIKNKCYGKLYNGFTREYFKNKKKLYDFLEYYFSIKDKMDNVSSQNRKEYCDYIEIIFQLYKEMVYNNISYVYSEDINNFKKIFLSNNRELSFLSHKCPGRCIHLVFNGNNNILCPKEREELKSLEISATPCGNINNTDIFKYGEDPEYEDILKTSPAYVVYNKLNKVHNYCGYKGYCIKMNSFEKQYPGISKLCANVVANLIKLHDMDNAGDSNQRCLYFMHWAYDKIRGYLNTNSKYIGDHPLTHELFDVMKKVNYTLEDHNKCYFDYSLETTVQELREMKYLHDYFNHYDHITEIFPSSMNKKNCCEYLTYINILYEKYIRKCCSCYESKDIYCDEDCPNYFKCDEKNNPFNLYSDLNCTKTMNKNLKKLNKPPTIDNYVKRLSTMSYEKPELLKWDNVYTSNISRNTQDISTYDPFYMAMITAMSVLGILLMFFVFYKFTPFGSYTHKIALEKKKIKENFQDEYELDNYSEISCINPKTKRLQIIYHQT